MIFHGALKTELNVLRKHIGGLNKYWEHQSYRAVGYTKKKKKKQVSLSLVYFCCLYSKLYDCVTHSLIST